MDVICAVLFAIATVVAVLEVNAMPAICYHDALCTDCTAKAKEQRRLELDAQVALVKEMSKLGFNEPY